MIDKERLQRSAASVEEVGADWGVLTSFDAVCYATGHIVPIEAGISPFAGGPSTAFIGRDGAVGLVVPNTEAMAARASWADVVEVYDGYTFAVEATLEANYLAAAAKVVRRLGASGSWAIEPGSFVASLSDVLPGERFLNVSPALRQARAIKTTGELQIMYRCAEAATIGQHAFLTAARPGRTELAVFADIRCAIEEFAGERVALTGDLLSGRTRTAGGSGWPISRSLKRGDPIIADIAPRLGGYWGDSCASMMLGDPTVAFQRLHGTASLALDHALDLIRPGIMARELDRRVRNVVERAGYRYPHHTGHSLGTAVHEFPRIVPYEEATLRTDMVLMIEPGAYDPETGGVRTEWMVRVTTNGCEVMTSFAHVASLPKQRTLSR